MQFIEINFALVVLATVLTIQIADCYHGRHNHGHSGSWHGHRHPGNWDGHRHPGNWHGHIHHGGWPHGHGSEFHNHQFPPGFQHDPAWHRDHDSGHNHHWGHGHWGHQPETGTQVVTSPLPTRPTTTTTERPTTTSTSTTKRPTVATAPPSTTGRPDSMGQFRFGGELPRYAAAMDWDEYENEFKDKYVDEDEQN